MRATLAALVLAGGASACAWDSHWTFQATRACYGGDSGTRSSSGPYRSPVGAQSGGAREAGVLGLFALGLLVLPLALDLACLPIAWPHDLLVCD